MNENERIELQRQIDLLVDGELSAEQERALLAKLEQEEAWRDCALTFVENQVLRRTLPPMVDSHPVAIPRATESPSAAPILHGARGWDGRFGQVATLAASVLIAFIAGQMIAPWMSASQSGGRSMGKSQNSGNSPQEAPLFVNYRTGDGVNRMPIAIDESKSFDPAAPFPTSFGMSQQQLQQLSDDGRAYQQKQQWIPVKLKDGREAVVPVQELTIEPPPTHYFP
ncbi:hypothetical protein LOC68_18300 [Blastopirellula sp. JC732]|uniref:Anti sigma-E protein RseA N-terminal domain-containing protein n=1 Tax=Blastopirellula sediminis TaxID=2894196 RepID=A0A9X1MP67_9BACT|nr:hypothetical protein [Blastopirellula sediminis]MCC9606351.1 hypothetical protein [Blastopirellula sediminis]MCC9630351.1 hypothetical protein [Blastopirellula sediminis]